MTITLSLPRDEFVSAIDRLVSTCELKIGSKSALQHFFYIRVDGYGNSLKLSAYNSSRRAAVLIDDVITHKPFSLGLSGSYLNNLRGYLPKGQLTCTIDKDFVVSADGFSAKFATITGDRFPQEQVTEHNWLKVNYEELFSKISKICYCSGANDNPRPFTKAVNILGDYLICTDGYRMSILPNGVIPTTRPMLLSIESARAVISAFSGIKEEGYIDIKDNEIHFSRGKVYMCARLMAGEPPNFSSAIPSGPFTPCEISKDRLKMALARITVITGEDVKSVPVDLYFGKDSLGFASERDGHRVRDAMPAVYSGGNMVMSLTAKYLTKAVDAVKGDAIYFELRGPEFPVVITDKNGEHRNIIMPQRRSP